MAACTSATFTATSLEFSALSSKSAFGSSCNVVQGAPIVRSGARVGAIRASSNGSEEARPARREILAGILAAGAALGVSNQASAASDPQSLVEEAGAGIKRRVDGLFGKNTPYPERNTQVTGQGAVADAKTRVNSFLGKSQNPLATNIDKATKEAASGLDTATGPNSASARAQQELLGKDRTRVDEATARVNAGADKLQGSAVQAFEDAKTAAGAAADKAKDVAPDAPNFQAPNPSGLFNSFGSTAGDVKGDVASKIENAKDMLAGQ